MIDQSNRAGKLHIHGNKTSSICSPTITKRSKHMNKSRDLSLNDRKLSRRTNPVKTSIISQQISPLYRTKGKSI